MLFVPFCFHGLWQTVKFLILVKEKVSNLQCVTSFDSHYIQNAHAKFDKIHTCIWAVSSVMCFGAEIFKQR